MSKILKIFFICSGLFFLSFNLFAVSESPLKTVKVGVLKWGTANWELNTLIDKKLDNKNKYKLEVVGLGSKTASSTALQGGEVNIILTDFIWVNRQRSEGANFTLVPHSFTVGGLITRPESGIKSISDLQGKKIGIAGGPVDKSWIILQAYAKQKFGIDLKDSVETVFAAPAVINEQIIEGNVDAVLNFWHYNATLKTAGMDELISVKSMLKEMDLDSNTPLLGWAFDKEWADNNKELITSFLDSSYATKKILLNNMKAWEKLKKKMKAEDNDKLFISLRDAYKDGIVSEFKTEFINSADKVFTLMSSIGGKKLVGDATTLDPDTFWKAYLE